MNPNPPRGPAKVTLNRNPQQARPMPPPVPYAAPAATEPPRYLRIPRKLKTGGSGAAAIVLFFLGGIVLLISLALLFTLPILGILTFILGIVLVVVAFAIDGKYRRAFFCGACGNEVAQDSRLCPICHAVLAGTQTRDWTASACVYAGIITALICAARLRLHYRDGETGAAFFYFLLCAGCVSLAVYGLRRARRRSTLAS